MDATVRKADPGRPRWGRRSLLVVGIVGAVAAAVVVATAWGTLGMGREHPPFDIDGPEASASRRRAVASAAAELDAWESRTGSLHQVGGTGWKDECETGQHNWKIQDAHARWCTLTVVRVYSFGGDFPTGARRAVAALATPECPGGPAGGAGYAAENLERDLARLGIGSDPGAWVDGVAGGSGPCASTGGGLAIEGWASLPLRPEGLDVGHGGLPRPCSAYALRYSCRDHGLDPIPSADDLREGDRWLVVATSTRPDHLVQEWERSLF